MWAAIADVAIVLSCSLIIGCRIAFDKMPMGQFYSCGNNSVEYTPMI